MDLDIIQEAMGHKIKALTGTYLKGIGDAIMTESIELLLTVRKKESILV